MKNQDWANYVKDRRKARQLTRRKLAELAKIDPSYVTLIERDGYVPRKDKVLEIARAIQADVDRTLLVAGYAPEAIPVDDLLDRIDGYKTEKVLIDDLRDVLQELFTLSMFDQGKVAEMLRTYIVTIRDRPSTSAVHRSRRTSAQA